MQRIAAAAAALAITLFALSPFAQAQNYPARTVSLVVPFPAGGGTDIVARLVAQKLSESLKGNVVVENRPGASAQIGTKYVVDAAPDGHTLLIGTTSLVNGPALFGNKLPYDHNKQLRPVISLADLAIFLSVNAQKFSARTVKEFVEQAKKMPNLNMGSAGAGTTLHMSGEWFKLATGLQALHVPFKGSAPQVVALGGGEVDWAMENYGAVLPMVQTGRVRVLTVASPVRNPLAPDVPTFKEAGLPAVESYAWYGFFAPAKTPKDVIDKLNAEAQKAMKTPAYQQVLKDTGSDYVGDTPENFGKFITAERAKWAKVAKDSGATLD